MKIVFFGDSITDMGRYRETEVGSVWNLGAGYTFIVASEISKGDPLKHKIINSGISGDRVVDLYARIKVDVWNHNPDLLSILVGINDVGHDINKQDGVEIDRFQRVYSMMIEDTIKKLPKIKIVLLEPFVLKGRATRERYNEFLTVKDYAKVIKTLSEKYGLYFIPLQAKFDEYSSKYGVESLLYDGVHPNIAGATLIANEWINFFNKEIIQDSKTL